jgi:hypothetical protein
MERSTDEVPCRDLPIKRDLRFPGYRLVEIEIHDAFGSPIGFSHRY